MSRENVYRLGAFLIALIMLAAFAPGVSASPPTQMGSFPAFFYNFLDKGGQECPQNKASFVGYDTEIFKFWPEYTSPVPGIIKVDHYMVCWNGTVYFPQPGTYTVYTLNDDGMNVWVNGKIAMNAWYDQGPTWHQGNFYIPAPGNYSFEVKYYNRTLGATACVSWGLKGQPYPWNCPYPPNPQPPPPQPPPPPPPCPYWYQGCQPPPPLPPPHPIPGPPGPEPCPYYQPNCYIPPQPPQPPPEQQCFYRVRYGDNLASIAWQFGVSVWQLAQWNGIQNPNYIYAGMLLRVCP